MATQTQTAAKAATGEGQTKRGTCPICGMGCFVEAKVVDDVPVSIRPDRTAGFPADCPRAGQAIDYFDHADRLNYPMKRVGKRGEGKWQRISWDQAMDEIAEKLSSIRDRFGPEAVQTLGGSYKGAGDSSSWRWTNLWGTPNILYQGKNCGEAELLAEWATYGDETIIGTKAQPTPGVTKCAVLWGTHATVESNASRKNLIAYKAAGGKIIAVDPRRTKLTDMADIWLQVRPGTDGALAYGMLNIIISEGLHDQAFVRDWCTGFDQLAEMVKPFTPERTAAITWVPQEKIVAAARMFATEKPGLIPFGLGVAELGKGTTSAVFGRTYLRAITGNLDVEGGARFASPPDSTFFREEMHWDKLLDHPLRTRDNISAHVWPVAGVGGMKAFRRAMEKVHPLGIGPGIYNMVIAPSQLPKAILEADPYPIKALIVQAGNPLTALGNSRPIYDALLSDNLELSVCMEHWMTPNSELADYVLPATDGLERPLLSNMWGFADTWSASRRTVSPMYERRDDYQLWRELGNRLGQEGMWPDTMEEWFDAILAKAGITHGELADQPVPWLAREADPLRWRKTGFATGSGKVELASTLLQDMGYPAIPEYEEPAWSPVSTPELFKDYPLVMSSGNSLKWYYRSQHRQLSKMRKQHDYARVTLHPDTAADLGLVAGQRVWVETPLGRIQQELRVDEGQMPGVAHADSHFWYPEKKGNNHDGPYGVWESNINAILPDGEGFSDYAGDCYMRGLICRVSPVEES
jgi:thiosulfate reductase/polysulfide reductase chain A